MKKEKYSHLQTITTLFDGAWLTYKKAFFTLIKVNIVPVAILALISLITAYIATYYSDMFKQIKDASSSVGPHAISAKTLIDQHMPDIINYFAMMFGFFCVSVLVSAIAYVVQIRAVDAVSGVGSFSSSEVGGAKEISKVSETSKASNLSVVGLYTSSAKFVSSYIWVAILASVAVFGGFILLIVPGVVCAVWFSLCTFVLILQGEKGKAALQKSKAYVRGIWASVFYRMIAIVAFMFLVGLARGVFQIFLNDVFSAGLHVRFIIDILFQLVVSPFFIVYMYELFKDVVRVNELESAE